MAQEVIMTKVSAHTKARQGVTYANGSSSNRTVEDGGMYTFVFGKGSNRVSETRHMTSGQAKAYKTALEG